MKFSWMEIPHKCLIPRENYASFGRRSYNSVTDAKFHDQVSSPFSLFSMKFKVEDDEKISPAT